MEHWQLNGFLKQVWNLRNGSIYYSNLYGNSYSRVGSIIHYFHIFLAVAPSLPKDYALQVDQKPEASLFH